MWVSAVVHVESVTVEQENTWTFLYLAGLEQGPKTKIFIQFLKIN